MLMRYGTRAKNYTLNSQTVCALVHTLKLSWDDLLQPRDVTLIVSWHMLGVTAVDQYPINNE